MSLDDLISRLKAGETLTIEEIELNQESTSPGQQLTSEEVDLIDSYFSRNYRQGHLLNVPEECYTGWKVWKDKNLRELGFLSAGKKDAIYNGNHHTIMNPLKYRPRINLREGDRENKPEVGIEPEHLGFKFWLQERIEMAAAGKGSPRMLQVISGKLDEKDAATRKWRELSKKIQDELEKDLLNEIKLEQRTQRSDSRAPILAMNIFNEVEKNKRKKDQAKAAKKAEKKGLIYHPRPTQKLLPIEILCREIVRSLFLNLRPKIPSDDKLLQRMTKPKLKAVFDVLELTHKWRENSTTKENLDWLLKWIKLTQTELPKKQIHHEGWVRLSLTSQSFMLTLANRLSPLIIKEWIPSVVKLSDSETKEMKLNESQIKELKHLRKEQYFGRRGEPTNPKTAKEREDKTSYNVRRLTRSVLFDLVTKGIVIQRPMKFEEWVDHSNEEEKDVKKFGSYSSLLVFSKRLINWTEKSDFLSFKENQQHAIYRWFGGEGDRFMYAPPQNHALTPSGKPEAGGYLTENHQKLIGGNHYDYERFNHPRCKVSNLTIETVNKLQKVQWEINLDLLLTMFRLELDHELRDISDYSEIDKRITRIECRHWAKEAFYSRTDLEKNTERDISLMWVRKIINHNANVFWHAWYCDWRGRLYSSGNGLSPQGGDLDKAMIRFKRWKPLGEGGRHWLFVHVHNMVAGLHPKSPIWKDDPPLKGQSFKERDDWVERNKEILIKIAEEPANYRNLMELDQHSGAKAIQFQRLAALIELRRVLSKIEDGDDWDSVTSGLPVYLDASCNGYQHVSTLLRNRDLAEHVNVVKKPSPNDEERGDLYQAISDKAKELCVPGNMLYDELYRRTNNKRTTKKLIDSICSRSIAKQPTMTRMYGKIDTKSSFSGREGKGKPGFFSNIKINDKEYKCPKCDYNSKMESWVEKHATNEKHWAPKWHEESPLYKALLGPRSDKKLHRYFPDESHNKITELVDKLYAEADKEVTNNAYNDYKESSRDVAKFGVISRRVRDLNSSSKITKEPKKGHYKFNQKTYGPDKSIKLPEHKYVVRWKLPDDFEVIHYYIKHVEPSSGHKGNPTHALSIYRHLLPDWYDLGKRKESILKRLEDLQVKGIDSFRDMHHYKEGQKGQQGLIEFLKEKLKKERVRNRAKKIKEVQRILNIPSIHLPRYESDEKERLRVGKQRSAIPPNLIHSLDAYHMRWTINQMPENSDLWAVHDAFGSHARDIPKLREKITQGFYNLHKERDINDWLEAMITEDMYEQIYSQDPDPKKKKKHVYYVQLRDHLKENKVDLNTIPSTRKGGGKPTKKDFVAKLLEENIRPPQKWVAEIDHNKMDQSLVDDIKESVFLVD